LGTELFYSYKLEPNDNAQKISELYKLEIIVCMNESHFNKCLQKSDT